MQSNFKKIKFHKIHQNLHDKDKFVRIKNIKLLNLNKNILKI